MVADPQTIGASIDTNPGWKVLIVDDEPEVHEVTRMVLGDFEFEGRRLDFLHAHSAEQARMQLRDHGDVAVVLLDVVMETDQAGLDLVHFIRRELDNQFVRIVLRTGQPGQAPEREVVASYDINDYKEKTELTSERLFTTLYATLRAYRDVMLIESGKRGLERVIESSAQVFSRQSSPEFAASVLDQIVDLLGVEADAICCHVSSAGLDRPDIVIGAAIGRYQALVAEPAEQVLPKGQFDSLLQALEHGQSLMRDDHYVLHFSDSRQSERLLMLAESRPPSLMDQRLLEVFCTNVSIAFENLLLNRELSESQSEMLCLLAGVAETRSMETANHVRRVGELAAMLAEACGLDKHQVELIRRAAPLHDIGKIGIPDAVLNKAGAHTAEETQMMRRHVDIGAEMLSASRRPLFVTAAEIARDHHENWDGSGYPRGLAGETISLSGRIVALCDVCDALGSRRCYKEAWDDERIRDFIAGQRGQKFDPHLVDLLFDRWDEVQALRERLPD
jgi:putative nucleotidyltransferase with HDIG domain